MRGGKKCIKLSMILILLCVLHSNLCFAEGSTFVPAVPNVGVITGKVIEVGVYHIVK